ncbi:MAG: hypothetical protein HRK26_01395 [Rickettsiaceae bacterium H1]|nr:hypothetical protein [Rickettsiaceae bacterium H1]
MTELTKAVFVQSEFPFGENKVSFGKTLERLAVNFGDFTSYPWLTSSAKSMHSIAEEFDRSYENYKKKMEMHGAENFLITAEAKSLFNKGVEMPLNYKIKYSENERVYLHAKDYYRNIS